MRRAVFFYRFAVAVVRLILPLQMRLRVAGAARCPRTGPLIIVANHLGLLDPAPIAVAVPRTIRILAKSEVFGWPLVGGMARWARIVSVRRGASDREPLRQLEAVLAQGGCILLQPEGTYAKSPHPVGLLPFKTGAAFLAARSGAIVLPIALTGSERVWHPARGWRPWHRPRVAVTFGMPYRPRIPTGVSTKAAYQAMADEMGRRIAALLPDNYRGAYAEQGVAASRASIWTDGMAGDGG
jgi:1-acyl-sn-glycerol-3-phosphate acyltransferase